MVIAHSDPCSCCKSHDSVRIYSGSIEYTIEYEKTLAEDNADALSYLPMGDDSNIDRGGN